ncbi:hypothetical protein SETIT_7G308700v2 [Setaria italica]|uniref:DUF309 domain-containing protein n=1 Tax=Setaria italica TaxID=4555 RepID=A0A368S1J9_SETIT|nr:uncharacterized protein LOC101762247 [Setaria italica]RCV36312.1 hypothetical protein SETIT_7G308700v2 [Setaria italica]RCV36313.1 hypothetical protein SETIT_7G308700v2 [Setaria italica]RCV36314.1 hypothetical protein SETIT_7G308700v2 [Setaria italica]
MALAPSGSVAPIYAGWAPPRLRQLPTTPARANVSLYYLRHRGSCRGSDGGGARNADLRCRRRLLTARGERPDEEEEEDDEDPSAGPGGGFDAAVALFNRGEFHACHDVVEELWYDAEDPARTLLHGILQCAVGFHHLFNQNHRGAMMELGEGLCKLRKLNLGGGDDDDPFSRFRDDVAAVLQFLYRTQKELAACTDDLCLTMDGSPSSYQLLGNFAAGQQLYRLEADDTHDDGASSIIFSVSDHPASQSAPSRVKLPTLDATEQNLTDLQRAYQYI